MKKIILTISAAGLLAFSANAQSVDFLFDTWVNVSASPVAENPTGWASFNLLAPVGMVPTVIKETAAPYQGAAAAKIVTQIIPALVPVPGYDTVGILATGVVDLNSRSFKLGTPYTARPQKASFAVKYQPATADMDTAFVRVYLTKRNTTTQTTDTIGWGEWKSNATITAWTSEELTIDYNPAFDNVVSDTIIVIASSSSLYRPKVNSTLYIDDMGFTGWVGTNDLDAIKNNISVFPSPAKANVTFNSTVNARSVEILDLSGRKVGVFSMTNNKVTVETIKYQSGIYIYNVLNDQNRVVGRGKFEVIK